MYVSLLLASTGRASTISQVPTLSSQQVSLQFVSKYRQPNYDTDVLAPLHHAQSAALASCEAAGGTLAGYQCIVPPPPVTPIAMIPQGMPASAGETLGVPRMGAFIGSIGYSLSGGNCVDVGGINNPGYGNPSDWSVTSNHGWIGATVLFTWNHTARETGYYPDGSIEVAQENTPGMTHHIPLSWVRGWR